MPRQRVGLFWNVRNRRLPHRHCRLRFFPTPSEVEVELDKLCLPLFLSLPTLWLTFDLDYRKATQGLK